MKSDQERCVEALVEKAKLENPELIKKFEDEKKASHWRKEYRWNCVLFVLLALYCFYNHQNRDGVLLILFMLLYRAVATIGDRGH